MNPDRLFLTLICKNDNLCSWVETLLVYVTTFKMQDSKFTYLDLTNFFTQKKVADCNLLMKSADAT